MLHGPVSAVDGKRTPNLSRPLKVAAGCRVIRTGEYMLHERPEVVIRLRVTPVDIVVPVKPTPPL